MVYRLIFFVALRLQVKQENLKSKSRLVCHIFSTDLRVPEFFKKDEM